MEFFIFYFFVFKGKSPLYVIDIYLIDKPFFLAKGHIDVVPCHYSILRDSESPMDLDAVETCFTKLIFPKAKMEMLEGRWRRLDSIPSVLMVICFLQMDKSS